MIVNCESVVKRIAVVASVDHSNIVDVNHETFVFVHQKRNNKKSPEVSYGIARDLELS